MFYHHEIRNIQLKHSILYHFLQTAIKISLIIAVKTERRDVDFKVLFAK